MGDYKSLVRVQNKDQENQGMFGSSETARKQDIPPENKQDCQLQFNFFSKCQHSDRREPPGFRQVEDIRKVVEVRN